MSATSVQGQTGRSGSRSWSLIIQIIVIIFAFWVGYLLPDIFFPQLNTTSKEAAPPHLGILQCLGLARPAGKTPVVGALLHYPQLDETVESIRLIRLEPGSGKDIINCTLESTTLENKPTFDALSYAWGESTDVSLIEVNGVMVEINESLWDALHHLRSETKAITLWVDALCIDQQNAEEKSRQVPLMDEIYNRAQTVHVWLGIHKPPFWIENGRVTSTIDKLQYDKSDTWIEAMYWLYQVIHEEYWTRVWIIQEIAVARNVKIYFGSRPIEWGDFFKLVKKYREALPTAAADPSIDTIYKLNALRQARLNGGETCSLSYLLEDFQNSHSSVMHDKIYAFLGIANDHHDVRVPVNYSKNLYELYQDVIAFQDKSPVRPDTTAAWRNSVEMVHFSALVRSLLSRTSELKSRIKHGKHVRLPGRKSFINYQIQKADLGWFGRNIRVWQPPKPETLETWYVPKPLENVVVRGLQAGTIDLIGPSYSSFISSSKAYRAWDSKLRDHISEESDLKVTRGKNEWLNGLLKNTAADLSVLHMASIDDALTQTHDSIRSRFFLGRTSSSQNIVGMAPEGANPGDIIYQFWNVETAAVLRKKRGIYTYIGRAAIVGDDNTWDKPADMDAFASTNTLVLRMSLNELTHLSLNTFNLTLPPEPYSSLTSETSIFAFMKAIGEEVNNKKAIVGLMQLSLLFIRWHLKVRKMESGERVFFYIYRLFNLVVTLLLILHHFQDNLERLGPFLLALPREARRRAPYLGFVFIMLMAFIAPGGIIHGFLQTVSWDDFSWGFVTKAVDFIITPVCTAMAGPEEDNFCQIVVGTWNSVRDSPATFQAFSAWLNL